MELEAGLRDRPSDRNDTSFVANPILKNVVLGDILPALEQDLAALHATTCLSPAESIDCYQLMRRAILTDTAPTSAIEWLLAVNIASLFTVSSPVLLRPKILMSVPQAGDPATPTSARPAQNLMRNRQTRQPQIHRVAWCRQNDKAAAHEIDQGWPHIEPDQATNSA